MFTKLGNIGQNALSKSIGRRCQKKHNKEEKEKKKNHTGIKVILWQKEWLTKLTESSVPPFICGFT